MINIYINILNSDHMAPEEQSLGYFIRKEVENSAHISSMQSNDFFISCFGEKYIITVYTLADNNNCKLCLNQEGMSVL